MRDKFRKIISIPSILKEINKSYDIEKITELENQMACMLASPIMFLASLINFLVVNFILKEALSSVLLNSAIFLILGISFELLLRTKLSTKLTSYIITALYSLWFLFFLIRMYPIIGPAIWMIACIQIVFALSRIKKDMAVVIGIITLLSSIYVLFHASDFEMVLKYNFFLPQTTTLFVLILILSITHSINMSRFHNLLNSFEIVTEQKNDITALYEEIAASEEELRLQNDQLFNYAEDIKKGKELLHNLAYYDRLTGLPNRAMFLEQLEARINDPAKKDPLFYVIFIDIDSFKKINDTLGHNVGDEFIVHAADNLKASIRSNDLLGRIGGDEFALLINRTTSKAELLAEIEIIREKFCVPYEIHSINIRLTASFGIAIYPEDGHDSTSILRSADMAMYEAKEYGKNQVKFFSSSMLDEMLNRTRLECLLFYALEKDELYLVYQPQYNAVDNKIRGIEVLTRWSSPELGLVPPGQFIPVAEETGFIKVLGEWILRTACERYKLLQEQHSFDALLCINISAVQLADANFLHIVEKVIEDTGINPKHLEFEITESAFIESFKNAVYVMNLLKGMGIRIALDDFGMGYSSLNYLKSLPIDTLKIDKTFIDDLADITSSVPIVGDIISLGHTLGLTIIAEGVEVPNQLKYLQDSSCDCIQGFLMARPIEENTLRILLEEHTLVESK